MATFKVVSRTSKEYNTVYIRISHNSKSDYIRTELTVHKSGLNKQKEVSDHFVLAQCAARIRDYTVQYFSPKNDDIFSENCLKIAVF